MRVAIIGGGLAGATAATTLRKLDPGIVIDIYSAESIPYYSRPRLWEYIEGRITEEKLQVHARDWYAEQGINYHVGMQITDLDPGEHRIQLRDAGAVNYDRLLLAMGARSFIPPITGVALAGVFALRSLRDAQAIRTAVDSAKHAAVVGGGLLGLEIARVFAALGLKTTVIEMSPWLLPRQLDRTGAEVLQVHLESLGIEFVIEAQVQAFGSDGHVTDVVLQSGEQIPAELVLVSTGVRSRVELAQAAGLEVQRGVVVDDFLQTSHADVFAAGDVAEHAGRVYGIIPAAIEQARAAAECILGNMKPYNGTISSTSLKVSGISLTSIGEIQGQASDAAVRAHVNTARGSYRKFVLREGKLVGAILLNEAASVGPVTRLIRSGKDIRAHMDLLTDADFDLKSLL